MPFAINPPGDAHEFEAEKCRLSGANSAQGTSKTKIVLSFPIKTDTGSAVSKDLARYDSQDEQDFKIETLFQPRGAQIEALYALENSRAEGAVRGLVQAATGVGIWRRLTQKIIKACCLSRTGKRYFSRRQNLSRMSGSQMTTDFLTEKGKIPINL